MALHSPAPEEDFTFVDSHCHNFVDATFGISKIPTFENTLDVIDRLKNIGHNTEEENTLKFTGNVGNYYDSGINNAHAHFVSTCNSHPNVRSVDSENLGVYRDRRYSDMGPNTYPSFYDFEFSQLMYDPYHRTESNPVSTPQTGVQSYRRFPGMVENVEKDGTIVPHVLIQSKHKYPHVITPVSPENSKLGNGNKSFLGMKVDAGQYEMALNGTQYNNRLAHAQYDDRQLYSPNSSKRARFNSVPNMQISTHKHMETSALSRSCCHSHDDIPQMDIESTAISYEELRNVIVDNFALEDSKTVEPDEEEENNKCEDIIIDMHMNSEYQNEGSVLQQILNDAPLMEAISKKQKRGAYKCAHCPETFNTIFEFAKHIDDYKVERKYKCPFPLCPWKFLGLPKLHELKRHCINQHNDELSPELQFLISGKRGPTSQVYHCEAPFCDKKFHRKDSYRRHVMMVHENRKSRFNVRLEKALKSCPEQIKRDPARKNQYLSDKMKHRRRHKFKPSL